MIASTAKDDSCMGDGHLCDGEQWSHLPQKDLHYFKFDRNKCPLQGCVTVIEGLPI